MTFDRRISNADAELIAQHLVDRLVLSLSDEKVVASISSVWSAQLDRHIGRTVRRGAYALSGALLIFIGIRLDAIIGWLKEP